MSNKHTDIVRPWDAFVAPTERLSLSEADGRIAASTIRQYPPGIPEIIPGMEYSRQNIESLKTAHAANADIIGVNMKGEQDVEVVVATGITQNQFDIETLSAQSIDQIIANEVADYFRESFCKAPYFHFAYHEDDPLQSLPHTLDFEAYTVSLALSDTERRKTCQDTLRELAYQKARKTGDKNTFDSVLLPDGFHLWTDKDKCRSLMQDRLNDPGYVTFIRDPETKDLVGLLHARMETVERLFYSEEWSDPLLFSQHENEDLKDNPKRFFKKIDYHFGLKPSDPIMTISAQVLDGQVQGGPLFYDMMKSMALKIKPEHTTRPLLCEIPPFGTAHTLNRAFTDRIVFGVLNNSHPVVFCSQTSQALFPFMVDKMHWHHRLNTAARQNLRYRTKHFIPEATDCGSVNVKPNGKLGLAVYATDKIPEGTRIAAFTGETYVSKSAMGLPSVMRDHAIQIGQEEYVFGYRGLAHCLCHSCDPNCGIRNLTEIFAIRDIAAGEHITWDYRCSENSDWVLENCLCGTERCTGTIENFDSLPQDFKTEYLSKSMVSEWIVCTLSDQEEGSTNSDV